MAEITSSAVHRYAQKLKFIDDPTVLTGPEQQPYGEIVMDSTLGVLRVRTRTGWEAIGPTYDSMLNFYATSDAWPDDGGLGTYFSLCGNAGPHVVGDGFVPSDSSILLPNNATLTSILDPTQRFVIDGVANDSSRVQYEFYANLQNVNAAAIASGQVVVGFGIVSKATGAILPNYQADAANVLASTGPLSYCTFTIPAVANYAVPIRVTGQQVLPPLSTVAGLAVAVGGAQNLVNYAWGLQTTVLNMVGDLVTASANGVTHSVRLSRVGNN